MNMLNNKCRTSFAKHEFLKKAQRANPRLYDIGCYNYNLALMLTPNSDEVIRLEKESRSKLSDLIRPFNYDKLNNLYDLFVPQREKSSEQRYFLERSRLSHINVNNGKSKESFNKQTTLLEKRMDESIILDKQCQSSLEIFKVKSNVNTIITSVELCKQKIANRTYIGYIDPFIQSTNESNFFPVISRYSAGLNQFLKCLNEEMDANLRYFNSLESEVDSLRSQLETQKTHFLNEIDRLSREYYYADHMNAILGVYTELDEVTNLQCDYLELLEKYEGLETELSKSKMMLNSFESVQKHAINLELELQQCKEKIKNDLIFKVNKSKDFCKECEQYFEIQDLKAQLQDKGIVISELKKLIEKLKGKSVDTKFEKSSVIRQPNAFKSQKPSVLGKPTTFLNSFVRKDFSKSTSVTQTHVSNDFSKPVTAQTLPTNKKSILKNVNVLAPGMYKLYTDPNHTRTSQLPQESRKTNKRVSFSTGVIPTTSVSRLQLKSNPQGDRVMHNNSQEKKQEVEDHRRSVELSKNKTFVLACNDSLNAKTLNVKSVSTLSDKCVLHDKHDMCLNEEMVADLRYFNSPKLEVDSLISQLKTQKTQFLNEIDRLSREYYYADHMNAILGMYTELDEVTNLQCDYLELFEKYKGLETQLSKSKIMSKIFKSVQQHAINLELELQQCKEKIKNEKLFKVNQTKDFCKEREQYFEIQDLKAQLQEKGIVIRVILTTSVGRLQLKSNPMRDRVMCNNSQEKKQEVEDHSRNVKLPKNKTSVTACVPLCQILHFLLILLQLVEIVLFIVDFGCSKHMTRNLKLLINFVEKFLGMVKFGNDQIEPILGYGDLVQGVVLIKRVYYVKGLNHNLFSVGQFCDVDLEVAFRKSTCYIRDPKGNDLLTGSRGTDLYSIILQDTNCPNPIYLMAKASSSQAWLWHHRLSHLNFDTINLLSKNDIVVGLPKLKFVKDHLCSSYELGKAKQKSFHTKLTPSSKRWLQPLHIDLCGPMRVASINGKRYVLVIIDDYSRYTWTHFLRSKDETPKVLIDFLRLVQRGLQAQVRVVRTDKGTEFLNQTLHAYFAAEGILH
nr:retrovirus-related Pol polyprotein from transposon TNT 1-94 [Tanacetum cinerariifolium]